MESSLKNVAKLDLDFDLPDIRKLKLDREQRNNSYIKKLDDHILPVDKRKQLSLKDCAAIKIQKVFRGFRGRRLFNQTLYNEFLIEEESFYKYRESQVKEGEIVIENYKIKHELEDTDDVDRNRFRLMNNSATRIQRFWREKHKYKYMQKDHICCPCHEDYPDLYEYYQQNNVICFCCDKHRLTGYIEDEYESLSTHYNDSSSLTDWFENMTKETNVDKEIHEKKVAYEELLVTQNSSCSTVMDELEPEESTKLLKSLRCHEEKIKTYSRESLDKLTLEELRTLVQKLESDISAKNLELVQELMTRDELHTCHEALMMEADDLTNGVKKIF